MIKIDEIAFGSVFVPKPENILLNEKIISPCFYDLPAGLLWPD
jgi:hypothetical protein